VQLTIDNLDGLGPVDYSAAIDTSAPFEVERTLNTPSKLNGLLCLEGSEIKVPTRRGRVVVSSMSGAALFTGYLTTEPVPIYAGEASEGAIFRYALAALSDEWLLDKQSTGASVGRGLGGGAVSLISTLAGRLGPGVLSTSGLSLASAPNVIGVFEPEAGATWSRNAGAVAAAGYSAYRALGGSLALTPVTSVVHALSEGDGSLHIGGLRTSSVRELANDVTVTGAEEPDAYWTELFTGDGTSAAFNLLGEPSAPNAGHAVLLADSFHEATLNLQLWQLNDPGTHIALGVAGLTLSGGTGLDGQTTLTAWDPLELGGTIVVELGNVQLAGGSAGVLGGLYSGAATQANCFAGFNIRQAGGQTIATPLVNGGEAGSSLTLLGGHAYTLRIRLHCPEMIRVQQSFYALAETAGGLQSQQFGGAVAAAPMALVFEARDLSASSNTPVTVLYDGGLASSPAQVNVVAVNSLTLVGSLGSMNVTQSGSCWIRSTSSTGTQWTRLAGKAADGADCAVTSSAMGKVSFFSGRVPAPGETITVSYRGRRRSVARLANPASLAAEAAGGAVGTARWLGHVTAPPARCEEDCEAAAQAILSFSTQRAAGVSGSYVAVNPPLAGSDIWPGDVLSLSTSTGEVNVIARKVTVSTQGASPEALLYHVAFANDWAEGLGIGLSEAIAKDAFLPPIALDLVDSPGGTAPTLPVHALANLQQLTLAGPVAGALTVDAGVAPPVGGGFEVRRRDGGFGSGVTGSGSGDLVLRSPVRGFSLPVAAADEIFFIRMYDGSVPPLYSRRSAAIVLHQLGS
jgi:hypothetical protein